MAMECQWNSRFRPMDGAFLETIESSQLSFTYGHTGCSARGRLSQSWAVCATPKPRARFLNQLPLLRYLCLIRTLRSDSSCTG